MDKTQDLPPRPYSSSVPLLRIVKLGLPIAAVMICAMGIWALMALAKFNSTLSEVTDSRISVIVYDMRDNIEQGLALGINLQALENVEDTIERAARRDPKISAIYVLGRQGAIRYRSPAAAPELSDDEIRNLQKAVAKKPMASSRRDGVINTVTILQNSFAQTVGLLVVKYDASSLEQRFYAFQRSFFEHALMFLAAGIALTGVVTWLILIRFERAEASLAQALEEERPQSPPEITLDIEFLRFRDKEREAIDAIGEAERMVEAR